jgi:hypothetical protein
LEYWNGAVLNNNFLSSGANSSANANSNTVIDEYDTIDNIQSQGILNNVEQKKVGDAAFSSLGEAPIQEWYYIQIQNKY